MPNMSFNVKVDEGGFARKQLNNVKAMIAQPWLKGAAKKVIKLMKVPGAPPPRHINWDSVRQRVAYFASDGFGGGIPSHRTSFYVDKWTMEPADNHGFMVTNMAEYSRFISGLPDATGQSKIHRGRWPLLRDAMDAVKRELPGWIIKQLQDWVDRGMAEVVPPKEDMD